MELHGLDDYQRVDYQCGMSGSKKSANPAHRYRRSGSESSPAALRDATRQIHIVSLSFSGAIMQNALNPIVDLYNSQLETSRQVANAMFSGVEKIDRVVMETTHRAFD